LICGSVFFSNLDFGILFERAGISIVCLCWIFVLWPTPCPRCGKSFLLFSLPNWGYWFAIYMKNLFNPFQYIYKVYSSPCPHCGLTFGEDPNAPQDSPPPAP
jgi:hypothetical protein